MSCLLSWYWEENGEHGREVLKFSDEDKAKEYAEKNLLNDDKVLDYDVYVSILEYKGIKTELEELKSKIARAIYIISD